MQIGQLAVQRILNDNLNIYIMLELREKRKDTNLPGFDVGKERMYFLHPVIITFFLGKIGHVGYREIDFFFLYQILVHQINQVVLLKVWHENVKIMLNKWFWLVQQQFCAQRRLLSLAMSIWQKSKGKISTNV